MCISLECIYIAKNDTRTFQCQLSHHLPLWLLSQFHTRYTTVNVKSPTNSVLHSSNHNLPVPSYQPNLLSEVTGLGLHLNLYHSTLPSGTQNTGCITLIRVPCIFLLFCKITNKSTITINVYITKLLHVSTLSCHHQTARIHYLAKLRNYINYSCLAIQFKLIKSLILMF